jgi:aspartate 1-decarboxylase
VIIITYAVVDNEEAKTWKPTVAFLNDANQISELKNEEKHGEIRK